MMLQLMLQDWLKDEVKQLLIVTVVIFKVYLTFTYTCSTAHIQVIIFCSV